jgi:hypothetical protein
VFLVAPGRQPLLGRVEADETYLGAARPGRPGRGAAGKAKVAGAVESARGRARGRRLRRHDDGDCARVGAQA